MGAAFLSTGRMEVASRDSRPRMQVGAVAAASVLALALAGCSSFGRQPEPPIEPNIYPTEYKPALLKFLQTYLSDPREVREAFVAEPVLRQVGSDTRYVLCLRYNAKDFDGRYEGSKEKAAVYFAGKMTQFVDGRPEWCGGAAYQPFPELQALQRIGGR
jgi:hypothetical protein